MPRSEDHAEIRAQLSHAELEALELANENGWLILAPAISDVALAYWQHECERFARPFAVVRLEPQRASLWFILAPGREWNHAEQRRVNEALTAATAFILTRNSARVFANRGAETTLIERLLAASPH